MEEKEREIWDQYPLQKLLQDQELSFSKVFYTAQNIQYILSHGNASGAGVFSSLISSRYPTVFFPGKTIRYNNFDVLKKNNFIQKNNIPVWGYRLNDIYKNLPDMPLWPLDISIIFSGKPYIESQQLHNILELLQVENLKEEIKTLWQKDIEQEVISPDFYEHCILEEGKLTNKFLDLLGILSLMLMRQFSQLFMCIYDDNEIEQFINIMKKRHYASQIIDSISPYMKQYYAYLNTELIKDDLVLTSIAYWSLNNISLGGSVGVITCADTNRSNILRTCVKGSSIFKNTILDYASWLDGYGEDGFQVEQNIMQKKYSLYIQEKSLKLLVYKGKEIQEKIITYDNVSDIVESYDIIMDTIHNSIIIGGTEVSSKLLHSQVATIHILLHLLEHIDCELINTSFLRSSYIMNKNEMQGKIIIPLIHLVKMKTGKMLAITCKGNTTHFYLKLHMNNLLSIGVIKNIF